MATLTSPTIEELIENVRNMLNQPDSTNSFWSDAELTEYLNEGVRRYFAEVAPLFDGQFTTTTSLNLVANTETVALPTDCFSVKALYKTMNQGYSILKYRNNILDSYSTTTQSGDSYIPYYYFRGNNIVLRPVPGASETGGLLLEYVQFPETMVNGGDSLTAQVAPVFKDLIQMYAVTKAKTKESLVTGVDTTALAKSNLTDLYMAFKESIQTRAASTSSTLPFNPESDF